MMKCDDREVAMRLGQLEPCEHDALLKVGGESLIRREIQIQRGVSRNWAGPGTGRVTSMGHTIWALCCSVSQDVYLLHTTLRYFKLALSGTLRS
jgi:hypothetical protein